MSRSAVFLDLNGTLVMPVQVTSPDEYQPIAGSMAAVHLLNQAGFVCPVVTVQSRIAKGVYSEQAFRQWFHSLQLAFAEQGATLLGPYLCPHSRQANCDCHKPKSTLYLKAAQDLDVDCLQSYVVGDTADDVQAGIAIGARSCAVQTGWASRNMPELNSRACFVGADISAVAEWIILDNRALSGKPG